MSSATGLMPASTSLLPGGGVFQPRGAPHLVFCRQCPRDGKGDLARRPRDQDLLRLEQPALRSSRQPRGPNVKYLISRAEHSSIDSGQPRSGWSHWEACHEVVCESPGRRYRGRIRVDDGRPRASESALRLATPTCHTTGRPTNVSRRRRCRRGTRPRRSMRRHLPGRMCRPLRQGRGGHRYAPMWSAGFHQWGTYFTGSGCRTDG